MEPLSASDPRTVGEFQLRARLGSGGMGRVYLGYSPAGRAVAVKVVRSELAGDPEFTRRFAHEVDAAKAVGGMYTAPVVAAGLDDDPPWLATAFVPGPSLASLVERHGPLSEQAVWRLAAGLSEALRAVHACGLVHRDLKPANVLLALDGPHLIDFGISRALDGASLTQTGMVVGTPGYMAPEQAEGQKAGPPSDVFSLGALLVFAATGNAPFGRGSAAAVLYRLVSGEPDLDGVPAGLRTVIGSCLAKDPGRRPDLPSLSGMIAKHGPGLAFVSATRAFWPSEVAGFIRASQPDFDQADERTLAPAGAAAGGALPVRDSAAAAEAASAGKPARDGRTKLAGNGASGVSAYRQERPGYDQPGYGMPRHGMPGNGVPAPGVLGNGVPGNDVPGNGVPGDRAGSGGPPRRRAMPASVPGHGQYPPAAPARSVPYGPYGPYNPYARPAAARPAPMVGASRLMRLGAAFSVVNAIVTLASISQIKASALAQHPMLSASAARAIANGAAGAAVVGSAVSIALWLWLARAARRGRGWVRPTGTALFGVYTLGVLSTIKNPDVPATKALAIVIWIIGLLAVIMMWTRRAPR